MRRDLHPASISRQARRERLGRAGKFRLLLMTCFVTGGACFINTQHTSPCMCAGTWLTQNIFLANANGTRRVTNGDSPCPKVDFIAFFQWNELTG